MDYYIYKGILDLFGLLRIKEGYGRFLADLLDFLAGFELYLGGSIGGILNCISFI